ncbi:MAG: DNA double-strand break repair nuclease NurA [Tissierellia bacterium]|nr:DNA double-strand break repair nuclease NurA [Tissierellia bacterium]
MYNINKELENKVKYINEILENKYKGLLSMDKDFFRNFLKENIGPIKKIEKFTKDELNSYLEKGGIVAVDGSSNKMGGAYPHFIEIYQGLAKSTLYNAKPIYKADFYTPLYDERNTEEEETSIRREKLSTIEIEAALESIEELAPYAIIMDGSLIRYDIESYNRWIELRTKCEEKGIILIGVIKDIKTNVIGEALKRDKSLEIEEIFYDRELLYGKLQYGEAIFIYEDISKKTKEGFYSLFMRSSKAPTVIGMDILDSQKEYLEEMARLVLTLTPEDSRGVPLWIDIVDAEVKIPDKMIRGLLESYINREILEMFFISERDKRTL